MGMSLAKDLLCTILVTKNRPNVQFVIDIVHWACFSALLLYTLGFYIQLLFRYSLAVPFRVLAAPRCVP